MNIRKVPVHHGWLWVVRGATLFKKSPVNWFLITGALLVLAMVIAMIPYLGVLVLLAFPLVLVGLMEGCRALEYDKELKFGYLLSGCVRNTTELLTLGAVLVMGNLLTMALIWWIGGDALTAVVKFAAQQKPTAENIHLIRDEALQVTQAFFTACLISVPLMMALWFAPMLVYFNHLKPLSALMHSFLACWKNLPAGLFYYAVWMVAIMLLTPIVAATKRIEFSLWILGPLFVPALYASYRDIFDISETAQAPTDVAPTPP